MVQVKADQVAQQGWDERVLELLACPACRGSLRLEEALSRVWCTECGRAFPVEDGIPVLIADRAIAAEP